MNESEVGPTEVSGILSNLTLLRRIFNTLFRAHYSSDPFHILLTQKNKNPIGVFALWYLTVDNSEVLVVNCECSQNPETKPDNLTSAKMVYICHLPKHGVLFSIWLLKDVRESFFDLDDHI